MTDPKPQVAKDAAAKHFESIVALNQFLNEAEGEPEGGLQKLNKLRERKP